MKKTLHIISLSICCFLSFVQLSAQQLPMLSEYTYNGFQLNPGMMGWEGITALSLGYRHQWTGMPNAPRTANLAFRHFDEDNNMGYGGYFVHDKTGPTAFTGVTLNYAYHIPFKSEKNGEWKRNRISLGLSLSALSYRLKGADLRYQDLDDPLIVSNNESQFMPDAGAGIYYYNDLYFVGFSVPQMISMKVKFNDDLALSTIRRVAHFYVNGGAKFKIQNLSTKKSEHKHYIQPTFWIKYAPVSPLNINVNVHYLYDDLLSAGVGFSSDGTFIADFSIYFLKNYRLGYAFSSAVNKLSPQLGTNHEIMFAYIFQSNGKGWFVPKVEGFKKTKVSKEVMN